MKRLRIVQITTDSREHYRSYAEPTPYFGSAPQALLEGFAELDQAEVHVVSCLQRPAPTPAQIFENLHYHSVIVPPWGWGKSLFAGTTIGIRQALRKIQPDIVHGQGTERNCGLAAVCSGFPNVLTIHGMMSAISKMPENRHSHYYRLVAMLEKFCLKRTNGVIAISNYTRNVVSPHTAKTWLVPNAVDPAFFKISRQVPGGIPRVLFVGRYNEGKNPIGLIKSCESLLREGRMQLILAGSGDGTYYENLRSLIDRTPNVTDMGFLDRQQLAKEFGQATMLVLPTLEDNCPMVVLEAMAAGLPVIASAVGGIPDLIHHGVNGLLVSLEQLDSIASMISTLLIDESKSEQLGTAGQQTATERFAPRIIAEKHLEIYREVLANGM